MKIVQRLITVLSPVFSKKVLRVPIKGWTILTGVLVLFGGCIGVIQWNKWNDDAARLEARKKQNGRRFRVLVPLLASKEEYLRYIELKDKRYDEFNNTFSRKVSRDVQNAVKAGEEAWFAKFKLRDGRTLSRDRVDFYFFPEGTDDETHEQAMAKAMDDAKKDGFEVVGVIGNVTSTATLGYGKLCGKEKYNLPMILPMATATNLTHSLRVSNVPAILRIPPANDKQAKLISDLLLTTANPALRTLIVKDLSNPVYSGDLVDSFRQSYVQKPLEKIERFESEFPGQRIPIQFGRILGVVPAGGDGGNPFMYSALQKVNPDALVLFGMTDFSLETIAQTRASGLKYRYLILTDGAVDEYLLPRLVSVLNDRQLRNTYLTFPLSVPMPQDLKKIMSVIGKNGRRNLEMTHALYVADAVQISLTILTTGIIEKDQTNSANHILTEGLKNWTAEAEKQHIDSDADG